jgi:hypothetical protein
LATWTLCSGFGLVEASEHFALGYPVAVIDMELDQGVADLETHVGDDAGLHGAKTVELDRHVLFGLSNRNREWSCVKDEKADNAEHEKAKKNSELEESKLIHHSNTRPLRDL